MNPVLQNIIVAFCSLVYVFAVVAIMDVLVKRGFPQDLSRKVVHIAAASWILFWPLYDFYHWTKYLNILPAVVWTILLIIKGLTADESDDAVKTMTRTGDRRELLKGPLFFTLVMNLMGTTFFYTEFAILSMGILGFGDGIAPLIGARFGKTKYKVFTERTVEGSLGFIIFAIIGTSLFSHILLGYIDLTKIILFSVISVIVEAISPKDLDNLLIPIAIFIFYFII
ncbi:MAG: phosphatidate cytidylyltransferase [Bacteroidetes bacterium]|nr:phosphatidate cytidylyltransferase [Bacteroidota bacterium]